LRSIHVQIYASSHDFLRHPPGVIGNPPPMPEIFLAISNAMATIRSEILFAWTLMACGIIGAAMAVLRSSTREMTRALVLGLPTGFVVFLAIKGGKHLFLLQVQGETLALNPYGGAFAALLAGLFTEKAYEVLSIIVNDFVERLKAAARR